MFVKFYDRLELSQAYLDNVLTVPANRAMARYVARERCLPRRTLTLARTDRGFWVYVFQLGADPQLGTVMLAGARPGPENVVTLPAHQFDRYAAPGLSLAELVAVLVAVVED